MEGAKARVYEAGFQDRCTLAFPGLVIDELQHVVLREGRKVELTSIEFEILDLLPGIPVLCLAGSRYIAPSGRSPVLGTVR